MKANVLPVDYMMENNNCGQLNFDKESDTTEWKGERKERMFQ